MRVQSVTRNSHLTPFTHVWVKQLCTRRTGGEEFLVDGREAFSHSASVNYFVSFTTSLVNENNLEEIVELFPFLLFSPWQQNQFLWMKNHFLGNKVQKVNVKSG